MPWSKTASEFLLEDEDALTEAVLPVEEIDALPSEYRVEAMALAVERCSTGGMVFSCDFSHPTSKFEGTVSR